MEFGDDTNSGRERERCSCNPLDAREKPLLREITNEPTSGSCPECGGESDKEPSGIRGVDFGFVRL